MKQDVAGNIWLFGDGNLEKINKAASVQGKLVTERVSFPGNFHPGNYLQELDKGRFLLMGYIADTIKNTGSIGSMIFNPAKNDFQLDVQPLGITGSYLSANFLRDRQKHYWLGSFNNTGDGLFFSDDGNEIPTFKKFELNPPGSGIAGKPPF